MLGRQQLARVERLGQVVVRAHLKADDSVGRLGDGGQHDDRRRILGANVATQLQPALAGQHDVENDEVDLRAAQQRLHFGSVGRYRNAHASLLEEFLQQVANSLVVVDDQYVRIGFHKDPVILVRRHNLDFSGRHHLHITLKQSSKLKRY